jgi:hypothetical protein
VVLLLEEVACGVFKGKELFSAFVTFGPDGRPGRGLPIIDVLVDDAFIESLVLLLFVLEEDEVDLFVGGLAEEVGPKTSTSGEASDCCAIIEGRSFAGLEAMD